MFILLLLNTLVLSHTILGLTIEDDGVTSIIDIVEKPNKILDIDTTSFNEHLLKALNTLQQASVALAYNTSKDIKTNDYFKFVWNFANLMAQAMDKDGSFYEVGKLLYNASALNDQQLGALFVVMEAVDEIADEVHLNLHIVNPDKNKLMEDYIFANLDVRSLFKELLKFIDSARLNHKRSMQRFFSYWEPLSFSSRDGLKLMLTLFDTSDGELVGKDLGSYWRIKSNCTMKVFLPLVINTHCKIFQGLVSYAITAGIIAKKSGYEYNHRLQQVKKYESLQPLVNAASTQMTESIGQCWKRDVELAMINKASIIRIGFHYQFLYFLCLILLICKVFINE